jgi:hypothetical protein
LIRFLRLALALVLALFPCAAIARAEGTPKVAARRPSIRFERVLHDVGEVPANRRTEYRWTFHNDGDAPLEILGIESSCECLDAEAETSPIPPAGTGTLLVTFDPKGLDGSTRKSIAVRTNDPDKQKVFLVLKVDVTPPRIEAPPGHPTISGQNYLLGSCATCHALPAADKTGEELYVAVCQMCHGARGEGARAPALRSSHERTEVDDEALAGGITLGTADPRMPGFSKEMAGPLTREQIASLVRTLRNWGPGAPRSDP